MMFRLQLPAFCTFASILAACTSAAEDGPYQTNCTTVPIETLTDPWPQNRSARVCFPAGILPKGSKFPLHLFAHGNAGGVYHGLQQQLASFGFVVPAYLSCWFDASCNNGESSFLEALKTIEHLEQNPALVPIDFAKPYTVSGHSTGARVAMMLAAVKDTPEYLQGTKFASAVTDAMRSILQKTVAFVGDHSDPMDDPKQNPDIQKYDISKSAVFLITDTQDNLIEPTGASWKNFMQISTPDKVFVNFKGDHHVSPNLGHHEGPLIAYFCRYHALGDLEARWKIYGNGDSSLVNSNFLAPPGATNNGDGNVTFLACASEGLTEPEKFARYCTSKLAKGLGIVV